MDKSKLPKMSPGKVVTTPWWKPKTKKNVTKVTQPGSTDDDAMRRAKERNDALKEAAK
jgi:hypothetical protein